MTNYSWIKQHTFTELVADTLEKDVNFFLFPKSIDEDNQKQKEVVLWLMQERKDKENVQLRKTENNVET